MPKRLTYACESNNYSFSSSQTRLELRRQLRSWVHARQQGYTHFITLSTNDPMRTRDAARRMLRAWDARVNHALLGSKWQKRPDERLVWFGCLEGLGSACHWHLLCRLSWDMPDAKQEKWAAVDFEGTVDFHWKRIASHGSTKTLLIESTGAYDYVTKRLNLLEYISEFTDSLSFKR